MLEIDFEANKKYVHEKRGHKNKGGNGGRAKAGYTAEYRPSTAT